jgi:primosomal protein N' (replication factor Y)
VSDCGNVDIAPLGRGTQRIEEALAEAVPGARVLRIDADSTRRKGSAGAVLQRACGRGGHPGRHADDRQGHDFQRVSLVGVLNADTALFSPISARASGCSRS